MTSEAVVKHHGSEKLMILEPLARTSEACPNRADGGLPKGAGEKARSQDALKERLCAPKSFAIGSSLMDIQKLDSEQRDIVFMREALKEAKKAFDQDEVPVGAVLVLNHKVIARGYNQVELLQDATAHAEIICLTAGAGAIGNWRLTEATLYCTLEPCVMCAGAMLSSRLKRLVWAAPDIRLGANGSWIDIFSMKHPMHAVEVSKLLLQGESSDLLRAFFQKQRKSSR